MPPATPRTVEQLIDLGYAVFIQSGAGHLSSFEDAAYLAAGADIVGDDVWNTDVILKINAPSDAEIPHLREGQTIVSLLSPALRPELVAALAERGVTALAMDAVPLGRMSRPEEIAGTVAWLLSPVARGITGQAIDQNGGAWMG